MLHYQPPTDDFMYLLNDVFDMETQWQSLPAYQHCNLPIAGAIIEEVGRLTRQTILPMSLAADAEGVAMTDSGVKTPDGFREAFQLLRDGAWLSLCGNP